MADYGGNDLTPQREPISLGGLQKFGMLPNMLYDFAANFSPSGIYNALAAPFQQAGEATDRALHSPALTLDPEAMHGLTRATTNFGLLSSGLPVRPAGSLGMFGGEQALGADLTSLAKAKAAETTATHPEQIWQQHGWWKGPDGKWRFEIPDDTSQLNFPHVDKATGEIVPPDPFTGRFYGLSPGRPRTLGEVFDHPDLYQQYPDLKNIKVKGLTQDEIDEGGIAGYDHKNNVIYVSGGDPAKQHSAILHEVQHAIQAREGFAGGANPIDFLRPTYTQERQLANHAGEIIANKFNSMGYDVQDVWDAWKAFDAGVVTPEQHKMLTSANQDFGPQFMKDFKSVGDMLDELNNHFMEGFKEYNKVAGEVESRAVQERFGMSRAELKQTFPPATPGYIPPHEQIVLQAGATP